MSEGDEENDDVFDVVIGILAVASIILLVVSLAYGQFLTFVVALFCLFFLRVMK